MKRRPSTPARHSPEQQLDLFSWVVEQRTARSSNEGSTIAPVPIQSTYPLNSGRPCGLGQGHGELEVWETTDGDHWARVRPTSRPAQAS